jgi:hypothetical protein
MTWIETLAPIATILSGITAGLIVVNEDQRIRLMMLALQYICVTCLISLSMPIEIAVIKWIAGWLACSIMGITIKQNTWQTRISRTYGVPESWLFRILAVLLISTGAVGLGRTPLLDLPGTQLISIAGALLLATLALLQLGLTEDPIGIGMGLLMFVSGFEIVYSTLESSLAVIALMATIHIGIALVVSIIEVDVETQDDLEA